MLNSKNALQGSLFPMASNIMKSSLVALTLLCVISFCGCLESSTAPSESQESYDDSDLLGNGGFLMPNGKYHKEDCGCNTCDAIRINLEELCSDDADDEDCGIDTVVIVDTVETTVVLEGEWLQFSAYEASKAFVKENYPERAEDRFSSNSMFCDYNAGTPAGRAGFKFIDNGDSTYVTGGYMFEYLFGAVGWIWGAAQRQPTEKTYYYTCTLQLGEDNNWTLLDVNLQASGNYIRDTRHD